MNNITEQIQTIKDAIILLQRQITLLESTLSPQEFSRVMAKELGVTNRPKTTKALLKAIGVIETRTAKVNTKKVLHTSSITQAAKATAQLRALLEKEMSNIERDIIKANVELLLKK